MSEKKPKMVTAVFRNRYDAEQAYEALRSRGYLSSDVNVLMSDTTRSTLVTAKGDRHEAGSLATEGMGVGGAIGTAVGATLAAVAAIGTSVAIPGLGIIVAGPILAALAGGGAGAVTGGLIGAMVGYGIPESNAAAYQAALREGGVVIGVVPRNSQEADEIERTFENLNGENICYC